MRTTPVDRGSDKYYLGAGIAVFFSIVMLLLGEWRAGLLGLALAGGIAIHPHFRRGWYWIGYRDGYDHGFCGDERGTDA
jgi:hypothetical protein